MFCKPEVLLYRNTRPKISVILIDWGVRESFHSLDYLNRQTAARSDYELIWLEFYGRKPEGLHRMAAAGGSSPVLDKWIAAGYPDDCIFHKHRLYNLGILLSEGEVCVICDSDAVFRPTFIESLIRAFEETPSAVIHLDEVRNNNRSLYPFHYPAIETILGPGCINWHGSTTRGLDNAADMIHQANYGACMAARRKDLLAVGGADEHIDYLGYICGPYEMTFRLVNYGRAERWLRDEYLYHVWHPNQSGINTDYKGPDDDLAMSLRALDARYRFRVKPYLKNPWLGWGHGGRTPNIDRLLGELAGRPEPEWRSGSHPAGPSDYVYWAERDHHGFNLFKHGGCWYALREKEGVFDPRKAAWGGYRRLLKAQTRHLLHMQVLGHRAHRADRAEGNGLLGRVMRKLWAPPLHRLPARVCKKGRILLSAVLPAQPPWETSPCPVLSGRPSTDAAA